MPVSPNRLHAASLDRHPTFVSQFAVVGVAMSDPSTGNNPKPASPNWIWELFSSLTVDPLKKAVGASVGALAVGVGWGLWNFADSQIRTYISGLVLTELKKDESDVTKSIKSIVTEELLKENGELAKAFKETLAKVRRSEVGAVNVGSFTLTPTNRSYTVLIYFPEKYTGKILYQIKGNIVPDCRYVVLSTPTGAVIKLDQAASINLEKYFDSGNDQALQLAGIIERPAQSKSLQDNLKAITFQLDGPGLISGTVLAGRKCEPAKENELTSTVEISYVSMVAPFIRMNPEGQEK
jgi:hypothetical protein